MVIKKEKDGTFVLTRDNTNIQINIAENVTAKSKGVDSESEVIQAGEFEYNGVYFNPREYTNEESPEHKSVANFLELNYRDGLSFVTLGKSFALSTLNAEKLDSTNILLLTSPNAAFLTKCIDVFKPEFLILIDLEQANEEIVKKKYQLENVSGQVKLPVESLSNEEDIRPMAYVLK